MAPPGLHNHPKFRRLAYLLDAPVSHVRGYLECLWDVAYENGDARIGDACNVTLATQFPGEPNEIVQALLNCGGPGRSGFIDEVKDPECDGLLYEVHDLLDHAPVYVSNRKAREDERRKEKVCTYCERIYKSCDNRSQTCSDRCRTAKHRKSVTVVTDCNRRSQSVTLSHTTPAPAPALLDTGENSHSEEKPKTKARFHPPTLAEVSAYCREKGYTIDPEHFLAHYEANGWRQANGNKIQKWKSSVVTWVKNQGNFGSASKPKPKFQTTKVGDD